MEEKITKLNKISEPVIDFIKENCYIINIRFIFVNRIFYFY